MNEQFRNQYIPDAVSPPRETLDEVLQERGMTQAELAERTGRPRKTIHEIVRGKAAITAETALQLEKVLGISASFWMAREQHYRESLAAPGATTSNRTSKPSSAKKKSGIPGSSLRPARRP